MPRPSAPSKIFEVDQKFLNMVKNFWTCSKNFNVVQNDWKWKEFEEKNTFKSFEYGQKHFECIQNF